jgi:hypothetical protein
MQYATDKGNHFFDNKTMAFFNSGIYSHVAPTKDGVVFITSEREDDEHPRLYTVRIMDKTGTVNYLNCKFQQFETYQDALNHADAEVEKLLK